MFRSTLPGPRARRRSVVSLLVLALLATLAPSTTAHAATNITVATPRPAPGQVVPDGALHLDAQIHAPAGVKAVEVRIDDRVVGSKVSGSGGRFRVDADVSVADGDHLASVFVTDGQGKTLRRVWRFSASGLPVTRLAGSGRVTTAVAISQDLYPQADSASAAVVAHGGHFADALPGAPVAGAFDGPLLLSAQDRLPAETGAELQRVLPDGATVYLMGTGRALSAQVEADVQALGFVTNRLSSGDRFGSAVVAALQLPDATAAFVTSATSFADALAASAPAARDGLPILLTEKGRLPEVVRQHLIEAGYETIYVVGGPAVVSDAVVTELERYATRVNRFPGAGRYETAAIVSNYFFGTAPSVGVVSGDRFPDALAGGVHAAAHNAPLLLTPTNDLPRPQVEILADKQPTHAYVYGGRAVVPDDIGEDLRRARLDNRGPREIGFRPEPGAELNALDTLEVTFDRPLDLRHSSLHVTLDGQEVIGSLAQGDFTDTMVFRASELPFDPVARKAYPVKVTALAFDGSGWRHLTYDLTYRKLSLSSGDAGTQVRNVQRRLTDLGYWLGPADGRYGSLTVQAVMAFQKANGLPRTGSIDARTIEYLETRGRPAPKSTSGRWVEVDKTRQILMVVDDGRVLHTFNTSTGTEKPYTFEGVTKIAHTPEGRFTFFRQIDGMREADLGKLWRPKYFTTAGHAIHGSTSIPAYGASHGCARLSYPAIDFIWEAGLVPVGTRIWIYR